MKKSNHQVTDNELSHEATKSTKRCSDTKRGFMFFVASWLSFILVLARGGFSKAAPEPGDEPEPTTRSIGVGPVFDGTKWTDAPAARLVPAFPGAEGFGMYARGGRAGRAMLVTNLNDAGPGSLREAIDADGPRTVLFRVSGTIELAKKLVIRNPFITIAGQSAPGDGICLAGYEVEIRTHDVIVRHLRVRPGDRNEGERDAMSIVGGDHVIADHCSTGWGNDETLSTTRSRYVTVQWCILAEALHNAGHHKGNHGYGSLIQGDGISYHHNLYAHNRSRNPRPASGLIDFVNNVIYNWNGHAGYAANNKQRLNYVANYLKAGPGTLSNREIAFWVGGPDTYVLARGNILEGVLDDPANDDQRKILDNRNGGNLVDAPHAVPTVKSTTAREAFDDVLKHAGATRPKRDAVDARVVDSVRRGTGGLIDSQTQVGGWPALASAPARVDSDSDGIPDEWESSHRLDPHDARDANLDRDADGYTNLEEFLNGTDPDVKD
jgi:pectate lyase